MTPSISSQTEDESLTGLNDVDSIGHHQNLAQSQTQGFLQPPLSGVSGPTFLADAADALPPELRISWRAVLQPKRAQLFMRTLINLLQCNQKTRDSYFRLRFDGEPKWAVEMLSPDFFRIPKDVWRMVQSLPDGQMTTIFATSLLKTWQDHHHGPQSPVGSPSPYRPRAGSLALSQSSADAMSSNSPYNIPSSGLSSNADDMSRLTRKRKRKHKGSVFLCPHPDCEHKKDGFVKLGICKNHVKSSHSKWTTQNLDWESRIHQEPQMHKEYYPPTPWPLPTGTLPPQSMSSPNLQVMTSFTGQIFLNDQHNSLNESYSPNPATYQFNQDATASSEDPFNMFPTSHPANPDLSCAASSGLGSSPFPSPNPTFLFEFAPPDNSLHPAGSASSAGESSSPPRSFHTPNALRNSMSAVSPTNMNTSALLWQEQQQQQNRLFRPPHQLNMPSQQYQPPPWFHQQAPKHQAPQSQYAPQKPQNADRELQDHHAQILFRQ